MLLFMGTPNTPLRVPLTSGNNNRARKYPSNDPKIPPIDPINNNSVNMLTVIMDLEMPITDNKCTIFRFCSNAKLIAE